MCRKQKRNEFRTCFSKKAKGHPTYIYEKVGERYRYIGITHAQITKGLRNIPLEKNPNPKDDRQSYMRPKTDEDKVSLFEKKPRSDWKFSKNDRKTAKRIIRRSKYKTSR